MKKMLYAFLGLAPLVLLATVAQTVEVPKEASDSLDTIVQNAMPATVVLSGTIMAIVQVVKRIMALVNVDVSGIKSQGLVIALAIAYAVFNVNVWDDGSLSQQDVIVIIQSVISAVGGIYGYKLLWRAPANLKDPTVEKKGV